MSEDQPTCDVCGKPATNSSSDLIEGEPVEGPTPDGKETTLWATWEKFGDVQYGCDEHPTVAALYKRVGPPQLGPSQFEAWCLARAMLNQALESIGKTELEWETSKDDERNCPDCKTASLSGSSA